eukprot:TRINITY_DN67753_c4_g1_i1.p1 TRINITY_DN67753_c4_g1~~TRINITY_DN67753_c4_g1_i1.p1  ORF type:complete len:108 (-),score=13.86 TRINITY_DN67753_c4_g1_i1:39-326(-)
MGGMYGQNQGGMGGMYGQNQGGMQNNQSGVYGGGYNQQQQPQNTSNVYGGNQNSSNSSNTGPGNSQWTEHKTDDGHVYWYNASTGVSQWERPVGF